jgi:DNA-binding GntR family transcriptional regulator
MEFDRRPLRDFIVSEILERLQAGRLPVGTRVDERVLAEELPVSRTPVREALSLLAYEGILEARMGNGFWVAPITAKEIEDAYSIILALESYAVNSIPPGDLKEVVARLRAAADEMEKVADSAAEAQKADDAWHLLLVAPCGNEKLAQVLSRVKQSVRRAEYALMQSPEVVARSVAQHRMIADALEAGDMRTAADLLDHNWRDGMRRMLNYLEPLGSDEPDRNPFIGPPSMMVP